MGRPYHLSIALFGFLTVSACDVAAPPVQSLALFDGEIMATTPAGYCIDTVASNGAAGFAVMAPCVSLGARGHVPDALGVATVQVGRAGSRGVVGVETGLKALLDSTDGAALLSGTGDAATVNVLQTVILKNTVAVYFNDTAPPAIDGLGNEEWRAFTDVNDRLVTVAVRGLAAAPLPQDTGSWLLGLVVTGVLAGENDRDVATPET